MIPFTIIPFVLSGVTGVGERNVPSHDREKIESAADLIFWHVDWALVRLCVC